MPTAAASLRPTPLANGLVYVNPEMPGLRRVRQGEHFRFKDAKGQWVRDADEIARIRSLAIPPAYTEVWICPLPNGHLQATGLDARGRKQYRYHPDWRLLKDESKFERLEAFGRALPRIRARVARDLEGGARTAPTRERVLATLVRLLDTTFLRVGNEEYAASNGSYGLTTLRNKHAAVRGSSLKLRFRGKSGVQHEAEVDDPRVAKVVRACQQLPGQELFQYVDAEGAPHGLSSTDVNDYLREAAGDNFTAKDFRTWHGTVQALELTRLACDRNGDETATPAMRYSAKEIVAAVARQLGNTPAVCRKAYVHPAVLALGATLAADAGTMNEVWEKIAGQARSRRRLYAAEARLLAFLVAHARRTAREAKKAAAAPRRARRATAPLAQAAASVRRTASRSMASA
ncbi:DNA topoisomerase IB [Variovorax sp. UMC13]|uniref:DNA topoisomerase IB n=1 Tax=Variovorax sp. UMC13 TaxID=1862326 RepID=UPI0021809ABF|nr:DNA topoisomerase IB [Variovorax sp. UMC13]MBB1600127.1 DNA topoisomerase [Variovorax sp. UMC13]